MVLIGVGRVSYLKSVETLMTGSSGFLWAFGFGVWHLRTLFLDIFQDMFIVPREFWRWLFVLPLLREE